MGPKPQLSTLYRFQQVGQNEDLPIVLAEYNVVQIPNTCV
jgi:hypothetical protein